MAGGQRAEQEAEGERDQEGGAGQQQGGRQAVEDQFGDRHLLAEGIAEIEGGDTLYIDEQLFRQRLVEAEFLAQLGDEQRVGGTGFTGHHHRGIAGGGADQEEVQNDNRQKNDDSLNDTLGNELQHRGIRGTKEKETRRGRGREKGCQN